MKLRVLQSRSQPTWKILMYVMAFIEEVPRLWWKQPRCLVQVQKWGFRLNGVVESGS